jgi:UrcA family protein
MRTLFVATAAGVLASSLVIGIAVAQTTTEVTVEATRVMRTNAGRTPSGVPIADISLSYGVSYSGLDLASHAGAMQLEKRVKDAATEACKEISRQYPDASPNDAECIKAATDKAMIKVRELEAAAAKKAGQ